MVQIETQPRVYRRPDLPAFDGLPMIDRAFCSALRVARTLGDEYATEGMDLEEVGLAHTMENLLYTIPQKCEAALGEHPTDVASFERWSNLDMVDRLWWMLREERTKVVVLVVYRFVIYSRLLFSVATLVRWFGNKMPRSMFSITPWRTLKTSWPVSSRSWRELLVNSTRTFVRARPVFVNSTRDGFPMKQPSRGSTNDVLAGPMVPATRSLRL